MNSQKRDLVFATSMITCPWQALFLQKQMRSLPLSSDLILSINFGCVNNHARYFLIT